MRTAGNDLASLFAAAGPHVENVVGIAYNVEVIDHHAVSPHIREQRLPRHFKQKKIVSGLLII